MQKVYKTINKPNQIPKRTEPKKYNRDRNKGDKNFDAMNFVDERQWVYLLKKKQHMEVIFVYLMDFLWVMKWCVRAYVRVCVCTRACISAHKKRSLIQQLKKAKQQVTVMMMMMLLISIVISMRMDVLIAIFIQKTHLFCRGALVGGLGAFKNWPFHFNENFR